MYNKREVFHLIYEATQTAIKLKWMMFCGDTVASNLGWAMERYTLYDEAVSFFNYLYYQFKDGFMTADDAYNAAIEKWQEIIL